VWNSYHQSRAIAGYAETVNELDETDYEKLLADAEAYNATLLGKSEDRMTLSDEEQKTYESLLDVTGTGIMGYVEIDKIDVKMPIYHGIDDTVLQVGAGHIPGTSLPVGGESTHAVICGHRGVPSAKLFTDLDQLEEGDTFVIHVLNRTLTYEVDQILIVEPEDISALEIEDGKDLCTLLTCTPYGINTERLLVRGHRVANAADTDADHVTADATEIDPMLVALMVALPVIILLIIVLLVTTHKRRNSGRTERREK
jgi:sortase A